MSELIQAIVIITLEAICCKIFFEAFLECRFHDKKYINYLLISILVLITAVVSVVFADNYELKLLSTLLAINVLMGIYFKGSKMQILFCSLGFYGVLVAIDKIMLSFIQYVISDQYNTIFENPLKVTLLALMCKSVLFVCVVFLNRKFKKEGSFGLITDIEWLRFLFFPALTIMTMFIFVLNTHIQEKYILLICFGMIAGNFVVFYMIKDIICREKKVQEMLLARERSRNETNMYIQMNKSYEEQKLKIHEFKNHVNCIQGLLENEQSKKALEYVRRINNSWIDEMDYIITNHAIVNTVLNEKYKKAKKLQIPMIMSVSDLGQLSMKDEDVVTLLANLLDNAIEAAEKIQQGDKYIKFILMYENGKLTISVRNPVKTDIKTSSGRIVTTKSDKTNHGIGMLNIDRVVKKYGGKYLYSCKEGYFTSTVIIRSL